MASLAGLTNRLDRRVGDFADTQHTPTPPPVCLDTRLSFTFSPLDHDFPAGRGAEALECWPTAVIAS